MSVEPRPPLPDEALPDLAERVHFQILRVHFDLTPGPVYVGMAFALLLAWGVRDTAASLSIWAWVAAKWTTGLFRAIECRNFRLDPTPELRHASWSRRYTAWLAVDAAAWGAIGPLFMPSGRADLDGVLLACLAGVAGIGMFTLQGKRHGATIFLSMVLLPTALLQLRLGTTAAVFAGLALLIYWGLLVMEGLRRSTQMIELVQLRHLNEWIAERHRLALQAAELSSQAKSRFLATVSHEVRTPLNGILGMVQLMRRAALPAAEDAQLQVIDRSARQLRTLIDDILDMARIEAGRVRIEQLPFEPAVTLGDVHALLSPLAAEKGLEFTCRTPAGMPPTWSGDAARVRQVLTNLAGNAIKFTAAGRVELELVERPQGLRFVVRDTGPGIDLAALERVFEPFEQAESSPARGAGGAGLGLAIARELARAMAGEITCASTGPRGTTFVFDVPASAVIAPAPAPAAPVPPAAPAAPPSARARVLVVEDNPVNAVVAVESLKRFHFEPVHVASGADALERLAGEPFDLVLMDCQMPGLDGYETTRRWREHEASLGGGQRLPIVAVTANAAAGDRERCLDCGMDDYLAKPFDLPVLRAVIERQLERSSR